MTAPQDKPLNDNHGPATCNYRECFAAKPHTPCPFMRDVPIPPKLEEELPGAEFKLIHHHHHTIPVEWETQRVLETTPPKVWRKNRVTKLRCECGDEIER